MLDKVKGFFFEEAPKEEEPKKESKISSVVSKPEGRIYFDKPASVVQSNNATLDQEKVEKLEGIAYPKSGPLAVFNVALESLQDIILDEVTRFRAASQVAAPQGVTTDLILQELNKSLTNLEANRLEYESYKEKRLSQVTTNKHQIDELTSQIEAKNEEIRQLVERRDTLHLDSENLESEMEAKTSAWDAARREVTNGVNSRIQKVTNYLKTSKGAKN